MTMTRWVSTAQWTIRVICDGDTILDVAPLMSRWKGQSFSAFVEWARKRFGPVRMEEL